MNKLTIRIRGVPVAKQSTRVVPVYGKGGEPVIVEKNGKKRVLTRAYQKRSVIKAENDMKMQIIQQLPNDWKPIDGPVVVEECIYIFPLLASFSKKKREKIKNGDIIYKTTKPDLHDNLSKALFDAMEGVVFTNDSRIVEMNGVKKIYGEEPGIIVTIREAGHES